VKICWDNLNQLRYNPKTGKLYKDRLKDGKYIGTNSYEFSENLCKVCGNEYLFATGNKNECCSLSCNTKYRNSIYKMAEETKKKISQTKTGVSIWSNEDKKNMRYRSQNQFWKGEGNPGWKGGVQSGRQKIYNTPEYRDWRLSVYERDLFTCQECGERGGSLNAHHIKTFADYPELRFEVSNGITLCEDCHKKIKGKEKLYEEKYYSIISIIVIWMR